MAGAEELGKLSPEEWEQLQTLAESFEAAWDQAGTVKLESYLPESDDPLRQVILRELIKTELEIRWRRQRGLTLDHYLQRYPELGSRESLPANLIYEEYRVRYLFGDKPTLESYASRFPAQFDALSKMLQTEPVFTKHSLSDLEEVSTNVSEPGSARSKSAAGDPAATLRDLGKPKSSPEVPLALSARMKVGDYELVERIGQGSFAEVWLAKAPGGIDVALKCILQPINRRSAKRELASLEMTKQLRHPFLLQTHRFWLIGERLWIAMELADKTLRQRLKECRQLGQKSLPVTELLGYFREAAEALDYLHHNPVCRLVHRDIKPENILLLQGHAKVSDFGLAKMLIGEMKSISGGAGTPRYMAPELWDNKKHKVSERTDQYSLAMAYAELRLGRAIFPQRDLMGLMLSHLSLDPPLDPLPEREQEVLRRALAKNPADRYSGCQAFMQALDFVLSPEQQATIHPDLIRERSLADVKPVSDPFLTELNSSAATPQALSQPIALTERDSALVSDESSDVATLKPRRTTRWLLPMLLAGMLLLPLLFLSITWGKHWLWPAATPSVSASAPVWSAPLGVKLAAGSGQKVTLRLNPPGESQPTRVQHLQRDPRLLCVVPTEALTSETCEILLLARPDAEVGVVQLKLTVSQGEQTQQLLCPVEITSRSYFLPNSWQPTEQAKLVWSDGSACPTESTQPAEIRPPQAGAQLYYSALHVEKRVQAGVVRFSFVFIPEQKREPRLAPFYVLQQKVTVEQYHAFASVQTNFTQLAYPHWQEQLRLNLWSRPPVKEVPGEVLAYPICEVPPLDAQRLAGWVAGSAEHGQVPTEAQWDKAAGRFENPRRVGPFVGAWDAENRPVELPAVVGRQQPLPVGQNRLDISPFGVQDLSGNGLEFTRTVRNNEQLLTLTTVPTQGPTESYAVLLRGCSWANPDPLIFEHLDDIASGKGPGTCPVDKLRLRRDPDQNDLEHAQRLEQVRRDTKYTHVSFRIVLEP